MVSPENSIVYRARYLLPDSMSEEEKRDLMDTFLVKNDLNQTKIGQESTVTCVKSKLKKYQFHTAPFDPSTYPDLDVLKVTEYKSDCRDRSTRMAASDPKSKGFIYGC